MQTPSEGDHKGLHPASTPAPALTRTTRPLHSSAESSLGRERGDGEGETLVVALSGEPAS